MVHRKSVLRFSSDSTVSFNGTKLHKHSCALVPFLLSYGISRMSATVEHYGPVQTRCTKHTEARRECP